MQPVMTFEMFALQLSRYFELGDQELFESTRFVDDLGFDSLQVYEALLFIEDLADASFSSDELDAVQTVGSGFHWYRDQLERRKALP